VGNEHPPWLALTFEFLPDSNYQRNSLHFYRLRLTHGQGPGLPFSACAAYAGSFA
jgi:hypothetical protein